MWSPHKCPTAQVADGAKLWRYVDLTRLLSLCAEHRLHFAPASSFADAKEGQLLAPERGPALRALRARFAKIDANSDEELSAFLVAYLEQATERTFISSWTLAEEESWLHWNRFGLKNTVALQTTVGALRAELSASDLEVVAGPVEYTDASFAPMTADGAARFFRKRCCFREEHEYRLLVALAPPGPGEDRLAHPGGLFVPVELGRVLAQVVVSPATPAWGLRAIRASLRALGYDGQVVGSQTV